MSKFIKSKKTIVIFFIAAVVLFLGFYPMLHKSNGDEKSQDGEKVLKVYRLKTDLYLKSVINEFKISYPKIKVDEVVFEDIAQYREKLSSEIMAGEGPDVVYFNSFYIDSINKVLKNGAFADLKSFIEADKDFKIEDYNSAVMECGVYNGKRYFLPVDYNVPIFSTTEEILTKNSIEYKTSYTQKEFIDNIRPYLSSVEGKADKYLSEYISFSDFIAYSGLDIIDYNNGKVNFDNPQLKEMVDNYKSISKHFSMMEAVNKYVNQQYDMLKDGSLLFSGNIDLHPLEFPVSYSIIKHLLKQNEVVFSLSSYNEENRLTAIAGNCLAINSNSKNKEAAFRFIKCALSGKIQSAINDGTYNIPVHKDAVAKLLSDVKSRTKGQSMSYNEMSFVGQPLPEKLEKDYLKIVTNIDKCEFTDYTASGFMEAALQSYFEDNSSYENSIKEAEGKINLYLNE